MLGDSASKQFLPEEARVAWMKEQRQGFESPKYTAHGNQLLVLDHAPADFINMCHLEMQNFQTAYAFAAETTHQSYR